jgi:hypothetical protein
MTNMAKHCSIKATKMFAEDGCGVALTHCVDLNDLTDLLYQVDC